MHQQKVLNLTAVMMDDDHDDHDGGWWMDAGWWMVDDDDDDARWTRPDQTRPDQTRPDQTRPDLVRYFWVLCSTLRLSTKIGKILAKRQQKLAK